MAVTINGTTGLTFADSSTLPSATFSPVYPVTASVGTNILTVTLNACSLAFRSSPLGSGSVNTRTVSSPISLTVVAANTLGVANSTTGRLVLVALDNAGTVELAIVNIAGGTNLDETTLVSTTAIGTSGATANNVVYSTTARSSVPFRVVGFVDAAYTGGSGWATAPSTIQGYGGNAVAAMSSLGYGQTWQSVTRAASTVYYNTTGKPITLVMAGSSGAGNFGSVNAAFNGGTQFVFAQSQNSSGAVACSGTLVVPVGASYALYVNNIGISNTWELR